jgi:hypothetical protein
LSVNYGSPNARCTTAAEARGAAPTTAHDPPALESDIVTEFEEWFGTEEEMRQHYERMASDEKRREAECVAGTRQRCACGAPSLFTDKEHGPLCAPCGYHYAN